ncbi:MAG: deoxyribodipyrimidine photo-lyase [Alicyclobacillaceae bacterium]|uniref:cryptochrome/photolyase family protein n=1 Tax=Alicyclobacillus sp. SP_1 TaxID=2942475 RepID=UPI0021586AF1|nr:deoxyribodipyrimidine photo-lyase [Alicyclobacillus sp. SP_1]MCY0895123.1 deoxyribodipyrimidine photo-lyase [Alicyclobacillaceae bacterium]
MIDTVVWLRRDLRLLDNPALECACSLARENIVPIVVLHPKQIGDTTRSLAQRRAFVASVLAFSQSLERLGISLHVLYGDPANVVPAVCAAIRARHLVFARDVTPYAKTRDAAVTALVARFGVEVHQPEERTITRLSDLMPQRDGSGQPSSYVRFSPFYHRFASAPKRPIAEAVCRLGSERFEALPDEMLKHVDRAFRTIPKELLDFAPGEVETYSEKAALTAFASFVKNGLSAYAQDRHLLSGGSSRLSYAFRSGTLSARWVYAVLETLSRTQSISAEAYSRQLAWRDFYYHLMDAHPESAAQPLHRPRRPLVYPADEHQRRAFFHGETGFPIIDAAMRQLNSTGFMSNRLRMLVASFSTKQLGIDWRDGERYFARHLLDYDHPLNVGGWQWAASVGTDAQPYFRMFDPVRQSRLYDPHGDFIRSYVPELSRVPDKFIHAPWLLSKPCREEVAPDYPAPIVDVKVARDSALERLRQSYGLRPGGALSEWTK